MAAMEIWQNSVFIESFFKALFGTDDMDLKTRLLESLGQQSLYAQAMCSVSIPAKMIDILVLTMVYSHSRLEPHALFQFLQKWLFALFKKPSNPAPTVTFVSSSLTFVLSALTILSSALASASSANTSALIAASAQTVTSPHLHIFCCTCM
ncbi:uncharacterized protein BJ212DRAFT_1302719 [Suillus subaureus]|uniref:Uncharacterized protein n=1 Tax=Suillus subaureus TaxID=48587 RepID=A0A9P7E2B9_9AGAM|nr:uncharacterized protein BJ212DRAFT_1302719 [Suillus subaureus]KAG1809156.1 hypothetical protein BJ212DRAFT_1302719 [Suillus subaureus]